jgi:hypothetical protein
MARSVQWREACNGAKRAHVRGASHRDASLGRNAAHPPPLLHPVGMHPYGMQKARGYPRFSTERSIPTEWQIRGTRGVRQRLCAGRFLRSARSYLARSGRNDGGRAGGREAGRQRASAGGMHKGRVLNPPLHALRH